MSVQILLINVGIYFQEQNFPCLIKKLLSVQLFSVQVQKPQKEREHVYTHRQKQTDADDTQEIASMECSVLPNSLKNGVTF